MANRAQRRKTKDGRSKHQTAKEKEEEQKRARHRIVLLVVIVAVIVVVAIVVALVLSADSDDEVEETQTVTAGSLSIEVPVEWTIVEDDSSSNHVYVYPDDYEGVVSLGVEFSLDDYESSDVLLTVLMSACGEADEDSVEESTYGDAEVVRFLYEDESDDGYTYEGYYQVVFSGDTATLLIVACLESEFDNHSLELESILDSMTVTDATAPTYSE